MSDTKKVTLLDLPSVPPCRTWSLNPWKTRLFLNYKGIPYTTRWTHYPDIPGTLSPHVAPHPDGTAIKPYTIPAVILSDGTWLQESLTIAQRLNELYPEPALEIRTPLLDPLIALMKQLMMAAGPEYLARIPERLLPATDKEYWNKDRPGIVKMPLEHFQAERGGAKVTAAVAEHVRTVGQWLRKDDRGPLFQGATPTYPDFIWAGFLLFFERIGQDAFDTVIVEDREVHLRFLEEIKRRGWTKRNDH